MKFFLLEKLFGSLVWNIPTKDPVLFLTFDDGPIPEVTPWVLETLKNFKAKATFFCIGDNVQKHPELFQQILNDGHAIGNHTFNHLNGWKTKTKEYVDNVTKCQSLLHSEIRNPHSAIFFRPPYGKIKLSQISRLKSQYKIVMWDVLSMDWKKNLTGQYCFDIIRAKANPGSIIVFHDSLKADERMRIALVMTLDYFSTRGFKFESLQDKV